MARPSKFCAEVADRVVKQVAAGMPRRFAARLAGIAPSTLFTWLRKGRRGRDRGFVEFLERVKRAEAEAVAARLAHIDRAAAGRSWQAAAWWLERRYPEVFGCQKKEIREMQKELRELGRLVRQGVVGGYAASPADED